MKKTFIFIIFVLSINLCPVFAGSVFAENLPSQTDENNISTELIDSKNDTGKATQEYKKRLSDVVNIAIKQFTDDNEDEYKPLPAQEKVSRKLVFGIFVVNFLLVIALYQILKLIDNINKTKNNEKNKKPGLLLKFLDIIFEILLLHLFPLLILLYAQVMLAYYVPLFFTYGMFLAALKSMR